MWTDPLSSRPTNMSLPSQRGVSSLRVEVMSAAWHESVLEHKTQDSKNWLFFCFHQAQGFSTASVHPSQAHCEARATWLDLGAPMRYTQRRLMTAFTSSK